MSTPLQPPDLTANAELTKTITEIQDDQKQYHIQARSLRKLSSFLNVMIVILGIAAPTLVTYQTQQKEHAPFWLAPSAILIVAIAGAGANLRSVLRWNERYGYTAMTDLKLRELSSDLKLRQQDILSTTLPQVVPEKLAQLNREAQRGWIEVTRQYLEKEVAAVQAEPTDMKQKDDSGGNAKPPDRRLDMKQ